jgi:hypothetical protein
LVFWIQWWFMVLAIDKKVVRCLCAFSCAYAGFAALPNGLRNHITGNAAEVQNITT